MRTFLLSLFFILLTVSSIAQRKTTLTDSLTKQFNTAWNANDLQAMISMLQPDAFFESPYQLRYSRDTMAATVLRTNPPAFKDVKTTELYSKVDDNIAWSLGKMTANIYDDKGKKTDKILNASYTFVFTRKDGKD
jgi:ketosteroid isomerase-like protein